jgi:hypothetical protein
MKKQFTSDIDIDVADRDQLLAIIDHTSATMRESKGNKKHGSGIYVTDVPYDAVKNTASIDHVAAEARGYVKLDLLNMSLYKNVRSFEHLEQLMKEPDWSMLSDRTFVENIIQINKHYSALIRMPEPINSIPRMAMFLAVIRPAKRHLIGLPWSEVAKTIWDMDEDGYVFKKSHSLAYSHLVVVAMNLECERIKASASQE